MSSLVFIGVGSTSLKQSVVDLTVLCYADAPCPHAHHGMCTLLYRAETSAEISAATTFAGWQDAVESICVLTPKLG